MVSEYFKGTQLFRTLIILSLYVFLIIMLFVMAFCPKEMIIIILVVLGIWVGILWIGQREMTIRILRKNAGKKILVGIIDQEEDMGEVFEFRIKKMTPFEDLSKEQKEQLDELTDKERELIESYEKPQKLKYIRVKEVKEIEDKSKTR